MLKVATRPWSRHPGLPLRSGLLAAKKHERYSLALDKCVVAKMNKIGS